MKKNQIFMTIAMLLSVNTLIPVKPQVTTFYSDPHIKKFKVYNEYGEQIAQYIPTRKVFLDDKNHVIGRTEIRNDQWVAVNELQLDPMGNVTGGDIVGRLFEGPKSNGYHADYSIIERIETPTGAPVRALELLADDTSSEDNDSSVESETDISK